MSRIVAKGAKLSACEMFRYSLTRRWSPGVLLPFIMLNPSIADAEDDDRTIHRCMSFAERDGYSGIIVAKLFAFRSPYPKSLRTAIDPLGPDNLSALKAICALATKTQTPIVCVWGASGKGIPGHDSTVALIRQYAHSLVCLEKTKDGHPKHPLYVRGDRQFEAF